MKLDLQNSMKNVSVNVDQMQLFVITINVGIRINVDVNYLIKKYVINNLFGILVFLSGSVITLVILVNIQTMKIANEEKKQLIN